MPGARSAPNQGKAARSVSTKPQTSLGASACAMGFHKFPTPKGFAIFVMPPDVLVVWPKYLIAATGASTNPHPSNSMTVSVLKARK